MRSLSTSRPTRHASIPGTGHQPCPGHFSATSYHIGLLCGRLLATKKWGGGKFGFVKQSRLKSGSQDLGLIQVLRFIFHEIQVDLLKWHGSSKIL
ncbi:MAG: hypothetical protein ACKO0V_18325 [bacterium]